MDDDVPDFSVTGGDGPPRGSGAFEPPDRLRSLHSAGEPGYSRQSFSLMSQGSKTAVALIAAVPLVALLVLFHELSASNSIMYDIRSSTPFHMLGAPGYPYQLRGNDDDSGDNGGGGFAVPSEVPTVYPSDDETSQDDSSQDDTSQATSTDDEAGQVTQILSAAAADRKSVVDAVADAQQCGYGQGLQSDLDALQSAQTDKQNLASQASNLDLSSIDPTGELASDLSRALDDSATADGDYASWVQDLQQQCDPAQATQDDEYVTAGTDSDQATSDKTAFLQQWNALAPQYGQQTWTESQI